MCPERVEKDYFGNKGGSDMKKIYVFSAALLVVAASCSQKEVPFEESTSQEVTTTEQVTYIQALGEQDTKASINGSTGAFTWNTGDKIAIYAGGYKISDSMADTYNNTNNATFAFSGAQAFDDANRANFAIFPASLVNDGSGNLYTEDVTATSLKINLPGTYNLSEIKDNKAPLPMIATNAPSDALEFKNLGALVRFTLVNVPKQTQYITFDFNGKKVQGEFTLTGVEPGTTAIQTSATEGNDDIITVKNNGVFSTFQTNLVVNIPVPAGVATTGEYTDVTVTTWDGEPGNGGHKINALTTPIKPSENWVPVRRGARKRNIELPYFSVEGSKKVVVAPGNLQAVLAIRPTGQGASNCVGSASEWRFAPNQYTCLRDSDDNMLKNDAGSIDLFEWVGNTATYAYSAGEQYGILFPIDASIGYHGNWTSGIEHLKSDWGDVVISDGKGGTYPVGTWRTPTTTHANGSTSDLQKLLGGRKVNNVLLPTQYAKAIIDNGIAFPGSSVVQTGVPGVIIFPDNYSHPSGVHAFAEGTINKADGACSSNIFSVAEWEKLEAVGCAFLPISGMRTRSNGYPVFSFAGSGLYWVDFSNIDNYRARGALINDTNYGSVLSGGMSNDPTKAGSRHYACAVRLIRDVN